MEPQTAQVLTILVSLAGLTGLVAIIGGFLHHRRERMLTHAERMKALEMGRPLPIDPAAARIQAALGGGDPDGRALDPDRTLARKCYSTGFWIAFWGFVMAASGGASHFNFGVAVAMAAGAASVGVTSIICGTVLAARARDREPSMTMASGRFDGFGKPVGDPDQYDVVSMRG